MKAFIFDIFSLSISLTPILAVLLLLAPRFTKRYIANFRYWLWLAVSIRLMVPLATGASAPMSVNLSSGVTENALPAAATSVGNLSGGLMIGGLNFGVIDIMIMIYLAGILVFSLYNLKGFMVLHKIINKGRYSPANNRLMRCIKEINQQRKLHIHIGSLKVLICQEVSGPMAVGLFRPVLLLPHENYNETQLRMILTHELVHIKRHDIAYKMLLLLVCTLHWFNPLVHLMARRANRDIEMTCDHLSLRGAEVDDKKIYSLLIIEAASDYRKITNTAISTGFKSGKESLEARIRNIFDYRPKGQGTSLLILILMALLAGGSLININLLPVQAAESIPAQGHRGNLGTSLNENILGDHRNTVVNDEAQGNYETMPINHVDEIASEIIAKPTPQQPVIASQTAELVVIDLQQMERETAVIVDEDNPLTEEL